jgi:copper ion binding protein
MNTLELNIPTITCQHCVHTVEMEIRELDGVKSVTADLEKKQATVSYQDPATEEKIRQLLEEINYPAETA